MHQTDEGSGCNAGDCQALGVASRKHPTGVEMTTSSEELLSRLEGVRSRGAGQWSARCPAHDDRSPSLSVRETSDGRLLLHCFGGCPIDEVVGAVGLELASLFPRSEGGAPVQRRGLLTASQALEVLHFESLLAWTAAKNLANGYTLTADDLGRLDIAVRRIGAIAHEVKS